MSNEILVPEPWPFVVEDDDGIRPAGQPDRCFYCHRLVGQQHKHDCVVVTKKVRLRYVFEVEVDVPHHWTEEDVLFHRNESSWCADNALDEIEAQDEREDLGNGVMSGCCCHRFTCEFIDVVDSTPTRERVKHG